MMRLLIPLFVVSAMALPATAKPKSMPVWPALGVETSIVFPGTTVRDFEIDEDRGFWLQDKQRRWYYARFRQPCPSLQRVRMKALDTQGYTRFDRTSVLWIDGKSCALEHFVTADAPTMRTWKKSSFRQPVASKDQHP